MTSVEKQYADIIDHATTTIIGDRQEISEDEWKQVIWMVSEILTDTREEEKSTS